MSDDLKGFQIQSRVHQRVDRPSGPKTSEETDSSSVGFPRIEALVEAGAPDLQGLATRRTQLQELAKAGSTKEKPAAQKAALAYERTEALVSYLLETKANMRGED